MASPTRAHASGRTAQLDFRQRLREIDLFFEGKDEVHKTMRRLLRRLQRVGIPYALVGGMAVNAHGYERTTKDVDVLLTRQGFKTFKTSFVPKCYQPVPGWSRRFIDMVNQRAIDILITGFFPGTGEPGPIAYPDPADVTQVIKGFQVVTLPTLIELKLAARRYQDFGDVVNLISAHALDEGLLEKLHPSLHRDYIECLEEKRREDGYKARRDALDDEDE